MTYSEKGKVQQHQGVIPCQAVVINKEIKFKKYRTMKTIYRLFKVSD
jgi:hypothetical protein